jgi:hypothetical protein
MCTVTTHQCRTTPRLGGGPYDVISVDMRCLHCTAVALPVGSGRCPRGHDSSGKHRERERPTSRATNSKPGRYLALEHTAMSRKQFARLAFLVVCVFISAAVAAADCSADNFSRPFSLLSDSNITDFLTANPSLPVALDDVRFIRFADENKLLVRGLIVPSLFDQRVTMVIARLHSYTSIRIDPSLDKLIDTIDDISWLSFFVQFIVAPSFPLYQTASQFSSQSSIDEWLHFFFYLLSVIEVLRFCAFVYKVKIVYERPSVLGMTRVPLWRVLTRLDRNLKWYVPIRNFAGVAMISASSYLILWRFAPDSLACLISNFLLFALPAWYSFQAYQSIKLVFDLRRDINNHKTAKMKLPVKMVAYALKEQRQAVETAQKQKRLDEVMAQLKEFQETAKSHEAANQDLYRAIEAQKEHIALLEKRIQERPQTDGATSVEDQNVASLLQSAREEKQKMEHSRSVLQQEIVSTSQSIATLTSEEHSLKEEVKSLQGQLKRVETDKSTLFKILKSKCIPFEHVRLGRFLGNGCFGYVVQAELFGENVAVKFGSDSAASARAEFSMEVLFSPVSPPTYFCDLLDFFKSLSSNECHPHPMPSRSHCSLNCVTPTSSAHWESLIAMKAEAKA